MSQKKDTGNLIGAMMVREKRKSWRGQIGRQDLMADGSGAEEST